MSSSDGSELSRLIGLILIVIGVIWLVTTGLCTGAFAISFISGGDWNDLGAVLLVGVPSAVIGGVIYGIGRWLRPVKR